MNPWFLSRTSGRVSLCSSRFAHPGLVHLPFALLKTVALLLLGASVAGYAQNDKSVVADTSAKKAPIHIMRPASGPAGASELRGRPNPRVTVRPNIKANSGSGIVYTCDPTVAASTCNYLNTTVAGWYNSTFTNANAVIYIQYGTTGLGQSTTGYYNFITYDQYVSALTSNSNKSAVQGSALSALNTYDAGSYGSNYVSVTGALGTILGFTTTGTTANGSACTLPSAGCYNGIITVTNTPNIFYYDDQGGSEPADEYDFYGVVAHETDEVLGTSSCIDTQNSSGLVDDCDGAAPSGSGTPSAVDLYRYSSSGELVLDGSLSTTPGAYFSYNGGSTNGVNGAGGTPKVYNTLANGDDYADFVSSSPDCGTDIAIQDGEGCPGEDAGLSILNDGGGEINILNAVGYDVISAAPAVTLSATSLAYGSEAVGSSTASQGVTLTNTGGSTLNITSIVLGGADPSSFVFANSCGSTLAAGANCGIHGHFAPTTTGALTATITITDNASGSPQTISLSGTGTGSPAKVTLSATSLAFGSEVIAGSTPSQQVTLTNSGGATLNITSIVLGGTNASSFAFVNNCPSALAAGANCGIRGHFDPTTTGALTATVTITDSASGSPQTIALSGTGTGSPAKVTLSAASLAFGSETVGVSTASQQVTLTNTGGATLNITSIVLGGANASSFAFVNNCPSALGAGANCGIRGHFDPTTTGALTATVTITDNASGSPQTIALSGTGTGGPAKVTLSATSLSYGTETVGMSTASQGVTLTNTGGSTLNITSIVLGGADPSSFVFANSCGSTLAAGANCGIHGHFAPTTTGALTATITITDSASGSPQSIALSGTGN